ncbi:AAA family ATPase [Hydrogenophaga soli]
MLTRLRIQGFKNIEDAEVRFGPFTCIAGANGAGKSNLFDAIQFLRDLTEFSLIEAAARVRDPQGKSGDIRAIFTQHSSRTEKKLRFEADFIVPKEVRDDFNRLTRPTATFLTYSLELGYAAATEQSPERLELLHEDLTYIPASLAKRRLAFSCAPIFRDSVISNERRAPYISTEVEEGKAVIKLHQDGGSRGQPIKIPAEGSPKTLVGGNNTSDYPTVLAARREMQSWTLLQLEPSAMRQPDAFSADPRVASNGAHMAATLQRLDAGTHISNKLARLLDDVAQVSVDKDNSRRTLTLLVTGRNGVSHPARALSDGTLRFLALAILAEDPESGRVLCLEEPENGIHPSRIPAILELLRSMAVDTREAVDGDNPLKQVIINTHSPLVVGELDIADLVMVSSVRQAGSYQASFDCIAQTWRATAPPASTELPPPHAIALGDIRAYIESVDTSRTSTIPSPIIRPNRATTVHSYVAQQLNLEFIPSESVDP